MRRRAKTSSIRRRLAAGAAVAAVAAALVVSCTVGDPSSTPRPTATASPTAPPTATAAPAPAAGGCYLLDYEAALKSTTTEEPVACDQEHTVRTFFVGQANAYVDGHLLAVDSARVQKQSATQCPQRFASYVGGSDEERRLSMLSVVWFGPTLAQSDEGQSWFRCDVIALATTGQLAPLTGKLEGILSKPEGRTRWGRCATAKPGSAGATHVLCSTNDAWRAVATVDVTGGPGGAFPGAKAARKAGTQCEDRVRAQAKDPLTFTWGYEPPSEAQWQTGQRYGFCWAPKS